MDLSNLSEYYKMINFGYNIEKIGGKRVLAGISFDEPPQFKDFLIDDLEQKVYIKYEDKQTKNVRIGVMSFDIFANILSNVAVEELKEKT